MLHSVHQFISWGDVEIPARELMNRFADVPCVAEASVHHADDVLTVVLINDPPVDLVSLFTEQGWEHTVLWRRS